MKVNVAHRLNTTGNITLKARVEGSAGTFMNAIFVRNTGELYVSAYQVEESLRGRYNSVELFNEVIAEATKHGKVDAVRGSARASNAQALTAPDGRVDESRIAFTPWAKALMRLGYDSRLEEGLLTSRRIGKEFS
jgi:hypothetical protein